MIQHKVKSGYIPRQLDIINMIDEPHVGREVGNHNPNDKKHNRRPFLIVSSIPFNNDGFVEAMPITFHRHLPPEYNNKLLPLHIEQGHVHGYIATFQILGRDAVARDGILIGRAKVSTLTEIQPYFNGIFTNLI